MSESLFHTANDEVLPFIGKLNKLKCSCFSKDPDMPKAVIDTFLELERKANIFNNRLKVAKAKGKTSRCEHEYGEKFKYNNKKYFDTIDDYLDKLEIKIMRYDFPYKERYTSRENFKESRKTISEIRTLASGVFEVSTKDIYNPKITALAEGILEHGQIFYHGTCNASKIKKEGFSLMPSKSQALIAPRGLGE